MASLTVNIPILPSEAEAAALEGFQPATKEQIARAKRYDTLQARKDALEAELKEIRETFRLELFDADAKVFTRNGKAIARVSTFTTQRIDSRSLREELPEVAAKYTVDAIQTRVTVGL